MSESSYRCCGDDTQRIVNALHTQFHHKVGIIEDRLRVREGHQFVVLQDAAAFGGIAADLGADGTTNSLFGAISPMSTYARELELKFIREVECYSVRMSVDVESRE